MWTTIKSVYKDTGKVQRGFLWFGFGMLVAFAVTFPLVFAAIIAVVLVVAAIISAFDFFFRICNE